MKEILIVDDDRMFLESITRSLQSEGKYEIDHATLGPEALEKMKREKFDLVILDYMLPVMNGLEILRQLHQEGYDFPVIMISAVSNFDILSKAMDYGASAILPKPIRYERLFSEIEKALSEEKVVSKKSCKKEEENSEKNILLLDDSKFFRRVIKTTLCEAFGGVRFIEVESATKGIETLHEEKIDLVILDINMAGKAGFKFLDYKTDSEKYHAIPVIMFIMEEQTEDVKKTCSPDIVICMQKPVEKDALIENVKMILKL